MKFYFTPKINDPYAAPFREIAINHNVRNSKLFSAIIALIGAVLFLINQYTSASHVFKYPGEYAASVTFIFVASSLCFVSFLLCKKMDEAIRKKAFSFISNFYAIVIVVSSLWITFVMQHNPSNTMSIFVLGILSVAALWIFEKTQTFVIAILILILFDGGLHYFQTDSCKLFANYITGTCVSIFFVCISRVCFSVNYKHFKQLKKIEQNNYELAKANEMQTEILSMVAHDLRSPNNSVIGLIDLVRDESATAEEKDTYCEMILTTCNMSNNIIDDLIQIARNDESDTILTHTCINDFIETTVLQFIKSKNDQRQIIFTDTPEKIYAHIDHTKMMRVFDNLINNAIKFTDDNGVITVNLKKEHNNISISVTDNGIGIPKELVPFLFNRFSRAGRAGLKGEKSYGLGLSICKLIIKQHHGEIVALSEEGKGTQIKISLPHAI